METNDRLEQIKSFSAAFRAVLADRYYAALRHRTYTFDPVLHEAMDDMSRRLLPTPEGLLAMEKFYKSTQSTEDLDV